MSEEERLSIANEHASLRASATKLRSPYHFVLDISRRAKELLRDARHGK